jgi:putative tricarboxylic transport membrane protein
MVEVLTNLGIGFVSVFQPINLLALVIGLFLGLLVAVLPGLTLAMGIVLMLPFTYSMPIAPSIILLTAMYVTGTYGGAFTAILFKIPGEPIDVPLLWDGYTMARNGYPAKALGWTLFAALFGGLVAATVMVTLSLPIARIALTFSSAEYFTIIVFGLTSVVALAGASLINSLISLYLGLLISCVGVDDTYGVPRYTFGIDMLQDGIQYITIMVGAYGIGEVLSRLEQGFKTAPLEQVGAIKTKLPSLKEIGDVKWSFLRGSTLGILIGMVPGAGATISSFVSYGIESQYGKRKHKMGTGIAEGIVAPQSAATASVGGAMVPLMTLGIPGSGATAIILAAFMMHGMQPGPQIFVKSPEIVYSIFASLYVGIIGMCVIGYLGIKLLVKVLDFPEAIVSVFVVLFCFVGAYSSRNNITDVWMIVMFGVVGYLFQKFRFPIAPMVLGSILGPLAENAFMTTMFSSQNDWTVFFTRPISGAVMALSAMALLFPLIRYLRQRNTTSTGTAFASKASDVQAGDV